MTKFCEHGCPVCCALVEPLIMQVDAANDLAQESRAQVDEATHVIGAHQAREATLRASLAAAESARDAARAEVA